jgi:hypothetical protein
VSGRPGRRDPRASRRALLAGTGTGAAVAGCTGSPGTAAPPKGLTVDEQADIRDYGAVAGGPDCTSAINSALAAVSRAWVRYGRIRVPKGLWHMAETRGRRPVRGRAAVRCWACRRRTPTAKETRR